MNMKNFSDTRPTGLYEDSIGEIKTAYYLNQFENFDQQEPGLRMSWNWAAFFGGGAWALYRKMYGWFVAWWVVATVVTVFAKLPNVQIHQVLMLVVGASWLGFTVFANSLYHHKIKARIATAQKLSTDASRVSGRLRASSGVLMWVPIVSVGIPVLGIVAAVALPAYQDYSKRQSRSPSDRSFTYEEAVAGSELSAQPDSKSFIDSFLSDAPAPTNQPTTKKKELVSTPPVNDQFGGVSMNESAVNQKQLEDQNFLRAEGVGGKQDMGDVVAWGDAQLSARSVSLAKRQSAHKFAIQWQYQFARKIGYTAPRSLFAGYSTIIFFYTEHGLICRPNSTKDDGGVSNRGDGTSLVSPECF